jgi:hypothetical protein
MSDQDGYFNADDIEALRDAAIEQGCVVAFQFAPSPDGGEDRSVIFPVLIGMAPDEGPLTLRIFAPDGTQLSGLVFSDDDWQDLVARVQERQ